VTYSKHVSTKATAQTQAVLGKSQVKNNAGGFVFQISLMEQLKRFLILGCEGGSYYASEKSMTIDNTKNITKVIQENGVEAVKLIVEVSRAGRAPKNDPAIFALALAMTVGDVKTKEAAYDAIVDVCRIGTHLFTLCQNIQDLRGWSRGLRRGIAKFYNNRNTEQLAMQLIKYRQRNGWTHKDVLRLSHVRAKNAATNELLNYAVGKGLPTVSETVLAFETAQTLKNNKTDIQVAIDLITKQNLPWEALPTELLNAKEIWEALIPNMGLTALVRNLGKMTSIGVISSNLDKNTKAIVSRLTNQEDIIKSRLHPLSILNTLKIYSQGRGLKGDLTWSPVPNVVSALEKAFYLAFGNVESTGKNVYLGLDYSPSMFGANISNTALTAAEASSALAMLYMKNEPFVEARTFSSAGYRNATMTKCFFEQNDTLAGLLQKNLNNNFGRTDCAVPMLDAINRKLDVDCFIIHTDNETYAGNIHPFQALKEYRRVMNKPNAKLIVVGMTSTGFSIADPSDKGMLDVVGFDTAVPEVINAFIRGEF
jgi:60 kDa SS-A/Ro ribonucleoprotein